MTLHLGLILAKLDFDPFVQSMKSKHRGLSSDIIDT